MKYLQLLILFLFFTPKVLFSQNSFTLNGYVNDSETGEVLIGATVYVNELKSGTVTNAYGFYSLTLSEGEYTIDFRYIGYESLSRTVSLDANKKLDIELISLDIQLQDVVVSDVAEDYNVNSIEMSTSKLDISKVAEIPTFLGENDIIKAIQLLPGVSSVERVLLGLMYVGGQLDRTLFSWMKLQFITLLTF